MKSNEVILYEIDFEDLSDFEKQEYERTMNLKEEDFITFTLADYEN